MNQNKESSTSCTNSSVVSLLMVNCQSNAHLESNAIQSPVGSNNTFVSTSPSSSNVTRPKRATHLPVRFMEYEMN